MQVKVLFDYPTIDGMIYKDEVVICEAKEFTNKIHGDKVKGRLNTGKIVWVPKKLLKKI